MLLLQGFFCVIKFEMGVLAKANISCLITPA